MKLNWLLWFSCPTQLHHTTGKWAFQRLILPCSSNSEKMEEKYMVFKPKNSKSFNLDLNSYCSRNLNCASAGDIL